FGLIGPMLGGFIVHHLSWRWVFYINLPFGVAAAAIVVTQLHEQIEKKPHTLDFLGAGLLAGTVVSLLLAASRLGAQTTVICVVIAVVLLVAFLAVERAAKEPVLPLPLFARPVMAVSSLTGAIIGGAMIATLTYVPLFVQGVLRGSPTEAGTAITPMVVGWPIASAIAGRLLPRVGFRPLIRLGLGLTAAAAVGLALFGETHGLMGLRIITAAFGVGMGFANTALLLAVQTSVTWEQRGIATASTMFFRTIGGTLAVGVMGGVINARLMADPTIPEDAASRVLSREGTAALTPDILARLGDALAGGLGTVFWIIAGMGVVAFVTSLWFPHLPTRPKELAPAEGVSLGH
ncbi:MAG: MFS transporter, partial [Byssovorax sp.]